MSSLKVGLSGHFKLVAVDRESGKERIVADWFDNLITDIGLNRMAYDYYGGYCYVGSGSTAPTVNDQVLANFVAESSDIQATEFGAATTAPYYGWERVKYRFAQGAAAGNVSEIGVGWIDTTTSPASRKVFSRTLVKDGSGNPTTVTVLSSEFLEVIHEIRMYVPTADVTGQITISGVVHNYILRACNAVVGQLGFWRPNRGNPVIPGQYGGTWAHSGDIAEVTASPSGTYSSISHTTGAYSDGSKERAVTLTAQLDVANFEGGIRCMSFGGINTGMWQVQFTPTIAKTSSKALNVTFKVSWARRP